jgi:hypothetical protein
MISPWGKQAALACHLTKKVNKAEQKLTYLFTNIGLTLKNDNFPHLRPML